MHEKQTIPLFLQGQKVFKQYVKFMYKDKEQK